MSTTTTIHLSVPDISCGHCEAAISRVVGALPGVVAVKPSSATKTVDIEADFNQVTMAQIETALSEEGYPVQTP